MFDEEEPGKPKNWGCTVAIIALMMSVNIAIFIVCRVLLDSEDEFDEPILQGELRDDVTVFLGVFSMTFCFGCCCCFCCGGAVFRWICRCRCGLCFDASRIWSGTIRRKSSSRQPSDDELDEMILATSGIPTVCSEVALNVDGNFLPECPRRAFSNQAFSGCLHEAGAAIDVELTRSIAYAAAAPPADSYEHHLIKQHRSKSLAF